MQFVIYLCNYIYLGCIAGSRVPSPFDSCNTCLCAEDGSVESCTRILCLEGIFKSNLRNQVFSLCIYCIFATIYLPNRSFLEDVCKVEGETCGFHPVNPPIDHGTCCQGSKCTFPEGQLGATGTCIIGIKEQ